LVDDQLDGLGSGRIVDGVVWRTGDRECIDASSWNAACGGSVSKGTGDRRGGVELSDSQGGAVKNRCGVGPVNGWSGLAYGQGAVNIDDCVVAEVGAGDYGNDWIGSDRRRGRCRGWFR